MNKKLQISLISLLYFIPLFLMLIFYSEVLPIFMSYFIGCLYSLYIVIFLRILGGSNQKLLLGARMLFTLSLTWLMLVFCSLGIPGFLIGFIFGPKLGPIMVPFFATYIGTYVFVLIIHEWGAFPKIKGKFTLVMFSLVTFLLATILNISGGLSSGSEIGYGRVTSTTVADIIIMSLVWQIIMAYYIWRRIRISNDSGKLYESTNVSTNSNLNTINNMGNI